MILLVSYDLNGHERPSSYAHVHKIIKENSVEYLKPMYSQWFVRTQMTPQQWTDLLEPALDPNDSLFVIEVHRPYQGRLKEDTWPWLSDRI